MAEEWEREPLTFNEKIIVGILILGIFVVFFDMKYEGTKWF